MRVLPKDLELHRLLEERVLEIVALIMEVTLQTLMLHPLLLMISFSVQTKTRFVDKKCFITFGRVPQNGWTWKRIDFMGNIIIMMLLSADASSLMP